jgi:tight adherence protein C
MFSTTTIFSLLLTLGLMLVVLSLINRHKKDQTVSSRLHRLNVRRKPQEGDAGSGFTEYDEFEQRSASSQLFEKLLGMIGVDYMGFEKETRLRFDQAGVEMGTANLINYVFWKKFGFPVGVLLALLLITGESEGTLKLISWVVAGIITFVGYKGADGYLKNRKEKRQYVLQRSFPDALDLVLVCVEAGLALDAALSRVCKEMDRAHPEITKELNKTRIELTLLNDRPKALQNLAERTDMVAFRALVSALMQSEKFGSSLTDTLRVLSEDFRNTRMLNAENKANRLPALMTIPLMLFMMPAFIMILMGPAIIMLMQTWTGI